MLPTRKQILDLVPSALLTFKADDLGKPVSGRTRDSFTLGDGRRISVVTDRIALFDRILGAVPYKGQVLNQLAAFWFEHTADIVPNSMIEVLDPNVMLSRHLKRIPMQIVVRGYITGATPTSLWYSYSQGKREIYGIRFPDGLNKNDMLIKPALTPILRTGPGIMGEMVSAKAVVSRGVVDAKVWDQMCNYARKLFERGKEVAEEAGLILVDALYEFGTDPETGALMLINELHTPDASRFWLANSYAARKAARQDPEHFDNEFVYLWYDKQGYDGEGEPPILPDDIIYEASLRYIQVYEYLTRKTFEPAEYPATERIETAVAPYRAPSNG
ncbi:MAG: phosphoribosylaminoimidazolesuccinocarboxamide synthase [Anaerolineae bacterium]|nr:phosphoribosylaminoimidazolesuccinocarboxamide synthase [Anaerolineae bacterium]